MKNVNIFITFMYKSKCRPKLKQMKYYNFSDYTYSELLMRRNKHCEWLCE